MNRPKIIAGIVFYLMTTWVGIVFIYWMARLFDTPHLSAVPDWIVFIGLWSPPIAGSLAIPGVLWVIYKVRLKS